MALNTPPGVTVIDTAPAPVAESSYVDWPAIIAGIVLATAISLVLISFGSAIGLNFVDFHGRDGAPVWLVGIGAALWFLWIQISSFMAGGYLTGRLRRRKFDATADESDLRDGAHGLLVWGGAMIFGAALAVGGIGALGSAVGSAATTAATAMAADDSSPNDYFVDTLFRASIPVDPGVARDEALRIYAQSALTDGEISAEDRSYLVGLVASTTALPPAEAETRVDQVNATIAEARDTALEAARIARNTGILAAFLIAASSLVSAIGAFWAAQKGGNHRDENTVHAGVFRRF